MLLTLWATVAFAAVRMFSLFRYSVDVPYWDQWNFVDFLRVTEDGASWSELWTPHNEHRVLVPNVVLLILARLTRWNIRAEIALVHALIGARFALTIGAVFVIGRKAKLSVWTCIPIVAAFLLSRGQAENLMWGWQVTLALGAFFTLLSCMALANSGWPKFLAATLLALASQFSFASGVVLWPIGAAFILIQPELSRRTRAARLSIWLATGALATFLYNQGLPRSPKVFPVTVPGIIRYSVTFLGAAIAPLREPPATPAESFAWRAGLIGIALFTLGILGVIATKQFTRWASIIMWGLTAPATAAVTAIGRLGFVPNSQAMSSRYITMSVAMWASAAILLTATVLHLVRERIYLPSMTPLRLSAAVAAGAICVGVVTMANPWEGWARRRSTFSLRDRAYLADASELTTEHKSWMYPDPLMIDRQRPYLISEKLTVFRARQPKPAPTPTPAPVPVTATEVTP